MAGVMTEGDEGVEVKLQAVPTIDGENDDPPGKGYAQVVASAHLTDSPRANGVDYSEVQGVNLTTGAYPAGTDNGESTNPLR